MISILGQHNRVGHRGIGYHDGHEQSDLEFNNNQR
jgi:hypothetical protein